jgi:hypothetical protein
MPITMRRFGRLATLQDHECPQDGARIVRELERRIGNPYASMLPPSMGMSMSDMLDLERQAFRMRAGFAEQQRQAQRSLDQQAAFHSYMERQAAPRRCPVCGHEHEGEQRRNPFFGLFGGVGPGW